MGGNDFNVPSFSLILDRLDLKNSVNHGAMRTPTRKCVIDLLLNRVRKNVMPENSVIKIIKEGSCDFYIITETKSQYSSKQRREQTYGPFQCVVGADGVLSLCRSTALRKTFLVGDARWASDRWYDLGLRRINQGADIAMMDGVTLGEALSNAAKLFWNAEHIVSRVNDETKNTFCAKEIFRTKIMRQITFFALLLTMFSVTYNNYTNPSTKS